MSAVREARSVLDLGAGVGTYAAAMLDAHPDMVATVVDYHEVIALARTHLARFGARDAGARGAGARDADDRGAGRVRFIAGDIPTIDLQPHDIVLLANVLHLHDAKRCASIVQAAIRATKPGGMLVIKDLRMDEDRRGPYESLAFALNMAIFTGGGDVYEISRLREWMTGLSIEEHRLPSQPDGVVLIGYKPRGATAFFVDATGIEPPAASDLPWSFAVMLNAASTIDSTNLVEHYTRVMPAMRAQQLASTMFRTRLDWDRMPRISAMLDRLRTLLVDCDVPFAFERPATLAEFYERTYYGGFMPLLYGYPADLAYFEKRGAELGLDVVGTIDRYFAAPMLHELTHFGRDREALLPPHLDECIAGWIGVHVWPEMAFPEGDRDDAIYAAPWLSQVGQAVARAFGVRAVVRAQAGVEPWDAALPRQFVDDATRFGWRDWCARRSQHFLADTMDPEPWVALARPYMRPDADFDRAIARDAYRAMCLVNECIDGSFRTRGGAPGSITIANGYVVGEARGVDRVPPRYWLPSSVSEDDFTSLIAT